MPEPEAHPAPAPAGKQARVLRIALTADPELPVPPRLYGGIERIVDMLARGLVARGHEVTVFAHPESDTAGRLVPWRGEASRSLPDVIRNTALLAQGIIGGKFDVLHSFSRLAYLTPLLPLPIPKLMTYQREVSRRSVRFGHALSRGTLWFSAVSQSMIRDVSDVGTWRVVFNGVPLDIFDYRADPGPDAPLVFLGRIEALKGPHLAIEVARRTGLSLVIAGNIAPEHQSFFDSEIAPHLDGRQIKYVGPVNDAEKNDLLGRARALLMPILWDEPFGIVMAEAMACGTPVIGINRGSVPEVVEHGVTGFVVDDVQGLTQAVTELATIKRHDCRLRAEQLFSDHAVVDAYLAVYAALRNERAGRHRKSDESGPA